MVLLKDLIYLSTIIGGRLRRIAEVNEWELHWINGCAAEVIYLGSYADLPPKIETTQEYADDYTWIDRWTRQCSFLCPANLSSLVSFIPSDDDSTSSSKHPLSFHTLNSRRDEDKKHFHPGVLRSVLGRLSEDVMLAACN